ncbi:MAG: hypothetical protein NTY90_03675 [Candidatus Micrarchaeota archaeon]|nr:hypothetical protein [Candidatus Micrarchaeota archaeon]
MDDAAQTAVEYLLLIGAALMVVIIVVALIRLVIVSPTLASAENKTAAYRNLTNVS